MRIELLKSQKARLAKILTSHSLDPADFVWTFEKSDSIGIDQALLLKHTNSGYYFKFDKDLGLDEGEYWLCSHSPGSEGPHEVMQASNWNTVSNIFEDWAIALQREMEAEDPWDQPQEEFAKAWTESNDKFTALELGKLDQRLDEIKQYLIEQSDKSKTTLQSIETGVQELKDDARKFGKKDWAMIFYGWFFMHCADWLVNQVHWQNVLTILLKGTKTFLLQA